MIKILIILVPTLWIGALIGVSFIAAPVKFRARSLTLPVALDVGRTTFEFFSRVERAFVVLLIAIYGAFDNEIWPMTFVGFLVGLVLAQSLWLLPDLNRRAHVIISGGQLPSSKAHMIYGITDGLKLLSLAALIASVVRQSLHSP